jgi:protein TonB
MILRYSAAALLAAAVTLALFFLMQSLIRSGSGQMGKVDTTRIVEFVRLRHESDIELKKRELPDRKPPEEPPPPELDLASSPKPLHGDLAGAVPVYVPEVALLGKPELGSAPGDSDVVPLVRVNPQYPERARQRGIEGWVLLEFTVTAAGTVRDVTVVDAQPKGYFDRAACKAAESYKYKPKVEDGVAVERPGVRLVISFQLED